MTDGVDEPGTEPDVTADVAEGQATDQSSSPLWDSWLAENEVPEPAHGYVRDALKHHDGLTTKKFQEHAEFRKQWEPYAGIEGFDQWDPEDLAEALPVIQMLMDEDQQVDAVRSMAISLGLLPEDGEDDEPFADDLDDGGEPEGPPAWFEAQFAPMREFMERQQQQELAESSQRYIDKGFEAIRSELGRDLTDGEDADIRDRAEGYARRGDQDPIASAWAAHKKVRTQVEKDFLGSKSQEPGRAEIGHSAPAAQRARDPRLSLEDQARQELQDRIAGLSAN
jgi:hypothetical protein